MSGGKVLGISLGAAIAVSAFSNSPLWTKESKAGKLAISESADRIVMSWTGPVAEPMRDEIAAAIGRFTSDPRRLLLTLNSPGGSIGHGHEVMAAIRQGAWRRRIDTHVDQGASCVSMCVPIFLLGANRTAHPDAFFMFHEASLVLKPRSGKAAEKAAAVDPAYRKTVETIITDKMYDADIGAQRVNSQWLREMRAAIVGKDVWVTAQQLVDAKSGVVDALLSAKRLTQR